MVSPQRMKASEFYVLLNKEANGTLSHYNLLSSKLGFFKTDPNIVRVFVYFVHLQTDV